MRLILSLTFSLMAAAASAECPGDWENAQGQVSVAVDATPDCDFEDHACRWSFALGNPASRQVFAALQDFIAGCPDLIEATRDAGVNHPDFYDAWAFRFPGGTLTLSIKDKSALDQTYVVLRSIR